VIQALTCHRPTTSHHPCALNQLMEPQHEVPQLLGDRFEQYEQIGHGSFGSVYRG
jgi:hypothetical protein